MKLIGTCVYTLGRDDFQVRKEMEIVDGGEYVNSDVRQVTDRLIEAAASVGGRLRALSVAIER